MGQFAAAYLVKEGVKALGSRDARVAKEAWGQLKRPEFWGSLAMFSGAARLTEVGLNKLPLRGLSRGLLRAALPLAAGMAAVHLISGDFSAKGVAISTAAFLGAALAVNLAADALVYPLLFAAGPPGWVGAALYGVGKLAATLLLGERLEQWLRHFLSGGVDRQGTPPSGRRVESGVVPKVRQIVPQSSSQVNP
jgi:hypothetical protein